MQLGKAEAPDLGSSAEFNGQCISNEKSNKRKIKARDQEALPVSWWDIENFPRDFPGGAVVKNLPANAGDTGSNPGPGRPHRPQSN